MLATLEGGCAAPIGALGEIAEGDDGDELWVRAVALSPDGALSIRLSATDSPENAADLGERLARDMLAEGAADLSEPPGAPAGFDAGGPAAGTPSSTSGYVRRQ